MSTENRAIDVFFYGLFMDEELLRAKGINPKNRRPAAVVGFRLAIGKRATLIPEPDETVYGVVFALTHTEIDSLYADASVSVYRPEAVSARMENGDVSAVLCFNLPEPPAVTERNPEYAARLKELAQRIGLPAKYVATIE